MLAILWKLSCTCNIPGVCKHSQKEHLAPLVMNSYGFCDPMMWDFELPLYFFLHTISTLEVVKIFRCSWSVNILQVLSDPSLWDQQGGIEWYVWIFFSFAPSNGIACLCSTHEFTIVHQTLPVFNMAEMILIYLGVVPNFIIYSVPVILHNSNMGRMKMQNSKNTPKK